MTPDLSIIISNYNTKDFLAVCLDSIASHLKNVSYEIIVVDDASGDGSSDIIEKNYPQIILLRNKMNMGYSKSYNRGTKAAKGKYILHLNSDTTFSKPFDFSLLIKYLEIYPDIGILGVKIIKDNGKLDLPCKRSFPTLVNVFFQSTGLAFLFPQNKIFGNYYLSYLTENKIHEVDCLMGAFMLIKKEVIDEIGYIDERFYMYGEDIDFCYRAKKRGWKIVYYPKVSITHHHGGTTRQKGISSLWLFHYAMYQYYQKHFASTSFLLINLITYLAILLRFLLFVCLFTVISLIPKRISMRYHKIAAFQP